MPLIQFNISHLLHELHIHILAVDGHADIWLGAFVFCRDLQSQLINVHKMVGLVHAHFPKNILAKPVVIQDRMLSGNSGRSIGGGGSGGNCTLEWSLKSFFW